MTSNSSWSLWSNQLTTQSVNLLTQLKDQRTSQRFSHSLKHPTAYPVSQAATQPVSPPPVPANLVRNQLRLCLLSSPCLQLICSSLMQLSCVLRAERHNKVIRLIRLAAPLLSPYAHYTYSIRCVMRFCTPSTRRHFVCMKRRAFLGVCVCEYKNLCLCVWECVWARESLCSCRGNLLHLHSIISLKQMCPWA